MPARSHSRHLEQSARGLEVWSVKCKKHTLDQASYRSVGDARPEYEAYADTVLLAAFLEMTGQTALVIGAGDVALRRTKTLLASGAKVKVIAPKVLTEFDELEIEVERRAFQAGDTQEAFLIVAATDNRNVNDQVAFEAKQLGKLVNHVGCAEQSTLRFPAVIEQHDVQVAVNTGRSLPILSQALCKRVGKILPAEQELSEWTVQRNAALELAGEAKRQALSELRAQIQKTVEASL